MRPFGESLVWHVIPADYFYTRETNPQVKVTVDDMPALSTGMMCDYTYFEGESCITGFTLSGTELTITGSDFVTDDTEMEIEMGRLACTNIIVAETADQITCDLSGELPAGSWYP